MKVSIIGAGQVGATAGFLIAQLNLADVILVDVVEGMSTGKAIDIGQAGAALGFDVTVRGTESMADIAGSDIVVVTAGLARKPGMTRLDLAQKNAGIIKSVCENIKQHAPGAIVITVTNPLDVMTVLAKETLNGDRSRVFGMGGMLDSSRFRYFLKQALAAKNADAGSCAETAINYDRIDAMVVGEHGDMMLPLVLKAKISDKPISDIFSQEEISVIADKARFGGAEIVSHLKTGSAFYAPAASITRMVKAILTDSKEIISTCVVLDGEFGLSGVAISLPAKIGKNGIEEIITTGSSDQDIDIFRSSAKSELEMLKDLAPE